MATKAKLSLSQLLFRRTNNNSNSSQSNSNNVPNNETSSSKSAEAFCSSNNDRNAGTGNNGNMNGGEGTTNSVRGHSSSSSNAGVSRRMSSGSSTGSGGGGGGRQHFYDFSHSAEILKANPPQKLSSESKHQYPHQRPQHQTPQQQVNQQLHSILKKPQNGGEFASGKPHRSSLHRSKSNPNPSNNPLKEVSWSCPTLEKRREVILNYFERIILENKQEQQQNAQNKTTTKPNIPCEGGSGEPIYEEISDYSSPPSFTNSPDNNSNKTGSLKPKLGPKKVRMNIPQDHLQKGQSPIYDKVLCRSHSMHESSSSSSSFYDVAPSTTSSISSGHSSSHHSLYENFRPSASYYATSVSSASSSDSDYGIVGGGGGATSGKNVTTRIAGRSHSFHDNYRNCGNYNVSQASTPIITTTTAVDTDQLYAKVCKRKKLKPNTNNEHQTNHPPPQRPSSFPSTTTKSGYHDTPDVDTCLEDKHGELHVQVSCGNVVTMIPVMMPCPSTAASSSFSTSCLSLSSSSDNNNDDMSTTITTSISSINTRPTSNNSNHQNNQNTGHFRYDAEKILPDKNISYINTNVDNGGGGADSCPASSAAARNRNNLSVIHLLAAYDPTKEIEEFIPTPSFTAIIDSTECAPKSISVPVRVGFTASNQKNDEKNSRKPLMVTNCNFGYDNDAFQDDDEDDEEEDEEDADADDEDNNSHHHKNLLRSVSTTTNASKDISSSSSGTSSTSGAEDDDRESSESGTSDTDTDEDEHHAQQYSFTSSGNGGRGGVLKSQNHQQNLHRPSSGKSIRFQEDTIITGPSPTITTDLLLLTTSESEDDCEELCEHKSLLEMSRSPTSGGGVIEDESKSDKYGMMDDEDRGFDSFLDDSSENNGGGDNNKGEESGSPGFTSENLRNQRTFAQMTQNVPPEQLKKKAASVLDLINSEISDLHMRELELKKLHSPSPPMGGGQVDNKRSEEEMMNDGSAEEEFEEGSSGEDDFSDSAIEYDGFTTNGSHSSGQVSPSENLNEMISHHQRRDEEEVPAQEDAKVDDKMDDKEEVDDGGKDNQITTKKDTVDMPRSEVKVRPLVEEEEEDRSIKFLVSDETPIEREIRLTREREEEFRRNNHNYLAICPPAPSSPKVSASLPIMKTRDVSSRPGGRPEVNFPVSPSAAAEKDMQLEMATARFKKEIEESMNREKELIRETRQKKIVNEEENEEVPSQQQVKDQTPSAPTPPTPPQQVATPAEPQSQLRKPTLAKLPIAKLPAARFFSPPAFNANKPSRITPVLSPTINKGGLGFPSGKVGGSLPIGGMSKPSFTTFEKYILQASSNYMANKQNGSTPPTSANSTTTEDPIKNLGLVAEPVVQKNLQFNIPEDPLRIVQKPAQKEESGDGDKEEEEEKPKRRYIPAQDKIHKEIQELAMREKELNRSRAKWKSTLDLPEALKDAEEEKETLRRTTSTTQSSLSLNTTTDTTTEGISDDATTTNSNEDDDQSDKLLTVTSEDVRQVTRVKAPARRRHSMLISQWEERIRQQQQQNSKK